MRPSGMQHTVFFPLETTTVPGAVPLSLLRAYVVMHVSFSSSKMGAAGSHIYATLTLYLFLLCLKVCLRVGSTSPPGAVLACASHLPNCVVFGPVGVP